MGISHYTINEKVSKTRVIAQGTPEEVANNPVSYTGQYVRKYLEIDKNVEST